jgi:hypothetical protein
MTVGANVRADQVFQVTINTSSLAANFSSPFAVDFELVGSNGNTVTLSNFTFGGGSAGPAGAFRTGTVTGSLPGPIALKNSSTFFNDFNQQFTPGSSLSFTLASTVVAPPAGGSPDNFSMVLFFRYDTTHGFNPGTGAGGTPIPTNDPSGANTLLSYDITGPGSTVSTSSGTGPASGVVVTVTPEPSSVLLLVLELAAAGAWWRWRGIRAPGPASL